MADQINLPGDTHRHLIVGATGSGKTQAAVHHLSLRNFDQMPWLIYDFKGDAMLSQIGAYPIGLEHRVPQHPGIYIVRPLPDEQDAISEQMMDIWSRGNTGVYVDEALMLGNRNKGFRALLTQGRSKRIPMIINSQRPAWIDTFAMTESEYKQVFRLESKRDIKKVEDFIRNVDLNEDLPDYHSYYYDVSAKRLNVIKPVPHADIILEAFRNRMKKLRRVIA